MSSDDNHGTTSKESKYKIDINPPEAVELQKKTGLSYMMQHFDLLTCFLSETIATGLLVFIGCMGCVDGLGHTPTHLSICLAFGFAVMLCLNVFGMVSGCHMNPAITLAAFIYRRITFTAAIVYAIGQLLGGFLGYGLLRIITPDHLFETDSFCVSLPSPALSTVQAVFAEFIISSILILMCCGVWDQRQSKFHDSVALRFGMVITVLALVGGPYSGGSMNPARSLGPAIYNWNFESHWIYWVSPMSAGLIIPIAFRLIFWKETPAEVKVAEIQPLEVKGVRNNEEQHQHSG